MQVDPDADLVNGILHASSFTFDLDPETKQRIVLGAGRFGQVGRFRSDPGRAFLPQRSLSAAPACFPAENTPALTDSLASTCAGGGGAPPEQRAHRHQVY